MIKHKLVRTLLLLILTVFFYQGAFAQRKEEFASYFRISGVSYLNKAGKANQMDVYMPKKGSKSPIVIWIHNGYWTSGDKSDVDRKPEFFTSKGYIFISINHRLSPDVTYTGQAQDVAAAITWIYNNSIHYSGDKEKIFLMGYGTGAHLASHVMLREEFLNKAGGSRSMIKGVVTMEGAGFDIPSVIELYSGKFQDGCEAAIGKSKKQWIDASPVTYIKKDLSVPPFLITFSGGDATVEDDSNRFSQKLSDAYIKNSINVYPKKNSNSINKDIGKEGDQTGEDILQFFYQCLRSLKASD